MNNQSLKNICIEYITKNPSFYFNYSEKTYFIPDNLSNVLLQKILSNPQVQLEHFKSIRGVTKINHSRTPLSTTVVQQLLKQFRETVEIIRLRSIDYTSCIIFSDNYCPKLKKISLPALLTQKQLDDIHTMLPNTPAVTIHIDAFRNTDTLKSLSKYVQKINLRDTTLTNQQLQRISIACPTVRVLSITHCNNITSFEDCVFKQLEKVNAAFTSLTDEGLVTLSKQCGKTIKKLEISRTRVSTFKECDFTQLENLEASFSQLTDQGVELLNKQCHKILQTLSINCTPFTTLGNNAFSNLKALCITAPNMTNKTLQVLSKNSGNTLKYLKIAALLVTSFEGCTFTRLKKLDIANTNITNEGLFFLSTQCAETLRKIHHMNTPITATYEEIQNRFPAVIRPVQQQFCTIL